MNPYDNEDREAYALPRATRKPTSEWAVERFDESGELVRLLSSGQAACAEDVMPDRWVDDVDPNTRLTRLCQRCPLVNPCLDYALDHDVKGVWGGTTHAQRKRMRGTTGRSTPEPVGFTPYLAPTRS